MLHVYAPPSASPRSEVACTWKKGPKAASMVIASNPEARRIPVLGERILFCMEREGVSLTISHLSHCDAASN